jgi:hypothetical protein
MKGDNLKLGIDMKTAQKHPKRLIRAVYPNGNDERGYHIVLTMQNAKPLAVPNWSTKWVRSVLPQPFGSC